MCERDIDTYIKPIYAKSFVLPYSTDVVSTITKWNGVC